MPSQLANFSFYPTFKSLFFKLYLLSMTQIHDYSHRISHTQGKVCVSKSALLYFTYANSLLGGDQVPNEHIQSSNIDTIPLCF